MSVTFWSRDRRSFRLLPGLAFCLMFWLTVNASGASPEPDFVLVAPRSSQEMPVDTGLPFGLTLVFTNPQDQDLAVPRTLVFELLAGSEAVRVEGEVGEQGPMTVPARGFLKATYLIDLPSGLEGLLQIQAAGGRGNAVICHVRAPKPPEAPAPMDDLIPKFQPFFVNFSPYKPVYFLFGTDPGIEKTSFQISFKYKLFGFEGEKTPFKEKAEKIYLAYTQRSFWDLASDSAPFEDSRYMPEIFYYEDDLGLRLPYLIGSGFQAGFQHESNGRGGDESRSTNFAYVQPILVFAFSDRLHLKLSPKVWVYVGNEEETNPDLADYRGYFDLQTQIGDPKGLALGNHLRHGRRGFTSQFDLSYPLNQIPGFKGFLDLYLHAQFFTGYSEQLLQYKEREDIFRLGFSLVR